MPIMCFSQSMAAAALRVLLVLMLLLLHDVAAAQAYGPGAIAGVFFGTFLGTLALCAAAFAIWFYATNGRCPFTKGPGKREKSADVEEGKNDVVGKHGHDNPNFHDDVDIVRTAHGDRKQLPAKSEKSKKDKDGKVKEKGKGERKGLGPFKIGTGRKQQAVDDISLNYLPPEVVHVPLKSHDIVGLGINIQGNMTDGIFISNVLSRGPASESGKVQKGDRILSVRVSFRNVTYEDALTILSYGSPYDVGLELEKARAGPKPSPSTRAGSTRGGDDSGLCSHPMYRSRSTNDLDEVDRGEAVARRLRSSGIMTRRPAATTTATGTTSVAEQYVQSSASTRSLNERFLVQAAAEGENGKAGKISVRDIAIAKPKRAPPRVMPAGGAPEVAHNPTTATRKEEEMVVRDDYGVDGAVRREDEKEEKTSKKEEKEKEKEKQSKGKEKKDKKKDKEAKIIIAGGGGESEKKDEKEDEKKSTSSSSSSNSSSSSSSSSDIDGKEKSEKKKVKKLTKLKKDKVKGKDKDKKKEKKEKSKDKKVKSNEVENDATRYKEVEIAINERGIDIGEQKTERLISTENEISTITTTTMTKRTEVDHQQQATPDLLKEVRTDVATEPTTKTRKMAPPKPSPRRKSQELKPGDVGHQPPPLPASPPPELDDPAPPPHTVILLPSVDGQRSDASVTDARPAGGGVVVVPTFVRVKRASSAEDLQDSETGAASPVHKRPKAMSVGEVNVDGLRFHQQHHQQHHPLPTRRKKKKAPATPGDPPEGYNFKETFRRLSDEDRADMIKISYEQPTTTYGGDADDKSHSDPNLSPSRARKEDDDADWTSLERSRSAERVLATSKAPRAPQPIVGVLKADLDASVSDLNRVVDDDGGLRRGKYDSDKRIAYSSSDTDSERREAESERREEDRERREEADKRKEGDDGVAETTSYTTITMTETATRVTTRSDARPRADVVRRHSSSADDSQRHEEEEDEEDARERRGVSFATDTKEETTTASEPESDVDGRSQVALCEVVEEVVVREVQKRDRPVVDESLRREERRRRLLRMVADAHEVPSSETSPAKEKLMSPSLERIVHDAAPSQEGAPPPRPPRRSSTGKEVIELSEDELEEFGPSPYRVLAQAGHVIKLGGTAAVEREDGFESWMYESPEKRKPTKEEEVDEAPVLLAAARDGSDDERQTPKSKVTTKVVSVTIGATNVEPYVRREMAVSPGGATAAWSAREKARMRIVAADDDDDGDPVPQMVQATAPERSTEHVREVSPVATSVHYMQTTADGRVHEAAPSGGANTITISTGKPVVHEDVTFTVTTNKPTSTPVTSATVTSSSQVKRSSIDVQQVYTETAHLY